MRAQQARSSSLSIVPAEGMGDRFPDFQARERYIRDFYSRVESRTLIGASGKMKILPQLFPRESARAARKHQQAGLSSPHPPPRSAAAMPLDRPPTKARTEIVDVKSFPLFAAPGGARAETTAKRKQEDCRGGERPATTRSLSLSRLASPFPRSLTQQLSLARRLHRAQQMITPRHHLGADRRSRA